MGVFEKETRLRHESFGLMSVRRVQGRSKLFGVDYEQGHSIAIELSAGEVIRSGVRTRYFDHHTMLRVEMSETQFAEMITSLNIGAGTPVTIRYAPTGPLKQMETPPDHMITEDEIVENGIEALKVGLEALAEARAELENPKMSKRTLRELLAKVEREIAANTPYQMEQSREAIKTIAQNTKIEIRAYADGVVRDLGLEALHAARAAMLPGTGAEEQTLLEDGTDNSD